MRVFQWMMIAGLIGCMMGSASAKEAFGLIKKLEGHQIITTSLNGPKADLGIKTSLLDGAVKGSAFYGKRDFRVKKDTVKPTETTTSSELVEFVYVGGTELWLVRQSGAQDAVIPGFGSSDIHWTDDTGYTYHVTSDEETLVGGEVRKLGEVIGSFSVVPSKVATHALGGRWTGELAFPGGFEYRMNLVSSGMLQALSGGCDGLLKARIEFSDAPYSDVSVVSCDAGTKDASLTMALLYLDSMTGETWFLSFTGALESGAYQGQVVAMPIFGGDIQEGVFLLFPRKSFLPTGM